MTTASHLLMLCGASFMLLAGIGVIRFQDVLARMHSLSKATTLGLVLVLIGGAFGLRDSNDITYLILGGALQFVTSPIGSNMLARATYLAEGIHHELDDIDELAEAVSATGSSSGPDPTDPPGSAGPADGSVG